jgi:hypothetical protein
LNEQIYQNLIRREKFEFNKSDILSRIMNILNVIIVLLIIDQINLLNTWINFLYDIKNRLKLYVIVI